MEWTDGWEPGRIGAVGMVWLGSWDGGVGVGGAGRGELQLRRDPEQAVGRVNPFGSLRTMVSGVGWCVWELVWGGELGG